LLLISFESWPTLILTPLANQPTLCCYLWNYVTVTSLQDSIYKQYGEMAEKSILIILISNKLSSPKLQAFFPFTFISSTRYLLTWCTFCLAHYIMIFIGYIWEFLSSLIFILRTFFLGLQFQMKRTTVTFMQKFLVDLRR
jgi:hypothetical protein